MCPASVIDEFANAPFGTASYVIWLELVTTGTVDVLGLAGYATLLTFALRVTPNGLMVQSPEGVTQFAGSEMSCPIRSCPESPLGIDPVQAQFFATVSKMQVSRPPAVAIVVLVVVLIVSPEPGVSVIELVFVTTPAVSVTIRVLPLLNAVEGGRAQLTGAFQVPVEQPALLELQVPTE